MSSYDREDVGRGEQGTAPAGASRRFDAIGSRYDEVFPHNRVYDPPTADVPPEIQLFLLAKRT
jgi:hypothetical protein